MSTLLIAAASFVGFLIAYHTYGRWLGRKIFSLDPSRATPAHTHRDAVDFVPTRKSVIFGHHFTSIAGTGPIVGPAIAVFWGWLPALLWVVFGSIFIGAVHDFGALVVSMRNQGQSIGQIAGRMISNRAKILLLVVLLLELMIVLAVFGLVIAVIFAVYPASVPAVWVSLPLAIAIGLYARKKNAHLLVPTLLGVAVIYLLVYVGIHMPAFNIQSVVASAGSTNPYLSPTVLWTIVLFIYCFIASVLPVWLLLQPRDYLNSQQLFVSLGLTIVGLFIAATTGEADLFASAPAIATGQALPPDAPPILPFLFITVACGAVSGFHSMVSSGTTSKQLDHEGDAKLVGYGSMVMEGALAVVVIFACCAGVGMGYFERQYTNAEKTQFEVVAKLDAQGQPIKGQDAWREFYAITKTDPKTGEVKGGWAAMGLATKIQAFVNGGSNFLHTLGIPIYFGGMMLAVMVACFAATTLDTATRLQRYVVQELGHAIHVKPMQNKYVATAIACVGGLAVAIFAGSVPGKGGMILWPLFGACNQILAGLGFLVIAFYLIRRNKPIWFLIAPAALMLILPAWAMGWNMFHPETGWLASEKYLLLGFGISIQLLVVWLILEAAIALRHAKQEGLLHHAKSNASSA